MAYMRSALSSSLAACTTRPNRMDPTLDPTGRDGIYTPSVNGPVQLVEVGPDHAPGELTAAGQLAVAQGWGIAIQALVDLWRRLRESGEMAVRRSRAYAQEFISLSEIIDIALSTGNPEAMRDALKSAADITDGSSYEIPEWAREGADDLLRQASALRTRGIDAVDAASTGLTSWHNTLKFVSVAGVVVTVSLAIRSIAKAVSDT